MPKGNGNIYQAARKAAGLTQEAAAERLAVSDTSIRAYESGERLPGDDIVARMCAVYNVQYLGLQHLQLKTALLPDCLQEARPEPLPVGLPAVPLAITSGAGAWGATWRRSRNGAGSGSWCPAERCSSSELWTVWMPTELHSSLRSWLRSRPRT